MCYYYWCCWRHLTQCPIPPDCNCCVTKAAFWTKAACGTSTVAVISMWRVFGGNILHYPIRPLSNLKMLPGSRVCTLCSHKSNLRVRIYTSMAPSLTWSSRVCVRSQRTSLWMCTVSRTSDWPRLPSARQGHERLKASKTIWPFSIS